MFEYAAPEKKSKKMPDNDYSEKDALRHDKTSNLTGIPNDIKARFEYLSGFSFDNVRIHYNSEKPAQLQALAYTQANHVYIGAGHEKYLEHELGHVIQQKRGDVPVTTSRYGININDDDTLEQEADRIPQKSSFSVSPQKNVAQMARDSGSTKQLDSKKTQNLSSSPDELVHGFGFNNLKTLLGQIIKEKSEKPEQHEKYGWANLEDTELNRYTEIVQELLTEMKEVDLQFLAVMTYSMKEHQPEKFEINSKYLKNHKNLRELKKVLQSKYEKSGGTVKDKNAVNEKLQTENEHRRLIAQKLDYLVKIRKKVRERLQTNQELLANQKSQLNKNLSTQVTVDDPKIKDDINETISQNKSYQNYLNKLRRQIALFNSILQRGSKDGYIQNPDVLFADLDKDVEYFMAIEAPSKERFKDIRTDEGKLHGVSQKLQIGAQTPMRAFSWHSKYLLNHNNHTPGTPPLIRKFKSDAWVLDSHLDSLVGEEFADKILPNAEDVKQPNQFGLPNVVKPEKSVDDSIAEKSEEGLLTKARDLETIVSDESDFGSEVLAGSGKLVNLDELKEKIGFGRVKDKKFSPSDIHFFDAEHTAFHEIKNPGDRAWSLYSYSASSKKLEEYTQFFNDLSKMIQGKEHIKVQNKEVIKNKLMTLLEANNCTPVSSGLVDISKAIDSRGNNLESLIKEDTMAVYNLLNFDDINVLINNPVLLAFSETTKKLNKLDILDKEEKNIRFKKVGVNFTKERNTLSEKDRNELIKISHKKAELKEYRSAIDKRENVINDGQLINEFSIIKDLMGDLLKLREGQKELKEKTSRFYDTFKDSSITQIIVEDKINKLLTVLAQPIKTRSPEQSEGKKIAVEMKIHIMNFYFRLMRLIVNSNICKPQEKYKLDTSDVRVERMNKDMPFDIVNTTPRIIKYEDLEINIPFDRNRSDTRFVRKEDDSSGIYRNTKTPFIGGVSGTTRDITNDIIGMLNERSTHLFDHGIFTSEEAYWNFQILNASFMVINRFHSFIEAMYSAAIIGKKNYGEHSKSRLISDYLKSNSYETDEKAKEKIMDIIKKPSIAEPNVAETRCKQKRRKRKTSGTPYMDSRYM